MVTDRQKTWYIILHITTTHCARQKFEDDRVQTFLSYRADKKQRKKKKITLTKNIKAFLRNALIKQY